jgi:polyhydroxyalkanoate synthesis regulator phasin
MKEKLEAALDVSLGAFVSAAERAKEVAEELAKRGRRARDEHKEKAASVGPEKGKRRPTKEALAADLAKLLSKMQIATAKDIARLEERIAELEMKLAGLAPPQA